MLNTPNETRLPVHAQVLDWLARQQQAMQDLLQKSGQHRKPQPQ